ncbi:hypothetical protein [Vulcaniibacterium tengchongense]|uniref:hypothetical protein n=1 Tax=Vulcaniibacterium tengchongense TaxID=1273429 RepID=UPI001F55331E|nr:hypothetical protein [Vulcaniibacterium tengchongense]
MAEALSRLIVHHVSEWGTPQAQWDAIDAHIPPNRKGDWQQEKQRIQSLQWRNKVPALGEPKIHHFHPISATEIKAR